MQDDVQKIIDYVITWFSTRPPSTWIGLVFFAVTVGLVIGITAWKRRKFLSATAEKLSTKITLLNVSVYSALFTASGWAVDALVNNSAIYGAFIPRQYLAHVTEVTAAAVFIHSISSELLKIWKNHQAKKSSLPDAVVDSIKTAADVLPETRKPGEPVTQSIWK